MPMFAIPVLVVAAIGYWVLVTAGKEQNAGLKTLGNIIGYVTVVVTAIALIFSLICPIFWPGTMGRHMMMMRGQAMGQEQVEATCQGLIDKKCEMMQKQGMMPKMKQPNMEQKGYKPMAAPKGEINK